MAALTMVLSEYSTQGRCRLQEAGLLVVTQRRVTSRAWLARSACLLVWGWYPDDRLTVAPIHRQKARQTPEVNWGPRSETMFWGIPCNRMVDQQIRRLSRGRELGQGDEMHHLREPVDHGHDGVVAPGGGETGDKI